MGCTQSGPENSQAQHNKEIGKYIEKDREQEKQVKKLLLLGSGSSGKSTLFKQIKRIHGVEVEPAEKNESKHVIRMNLVQGMLVLLQQAHKLFEADPIGNKKCQVTYCIDLLLSYIGFVGVLEVVYNCILFCLKM